MERNAFTLPAVAEILEESYIESRLHMDDKGLPGNLMTYHREMQKRYAETIAAPTYAIVDPSTGDRLGKFTLDVGGLGFDGIFTAFEDWLRETAEDHRKANGKVSNSKVSNGKPGG